MKNKWIAILLAIFTGVFGLHWFYLRKEKLGLLYIFLSWTWITWILWLIDAIRLSLMKESLFQKRYSTVSITHREDLLEEFQQNFAKKKIGPDSLLSKNESTEKTYSHVWCIHCWAHRVIDWKCDYCGTLIISKLYWQEKKVENY